VGSNAYEFELGQWVVPPRVRCESTNGRRGCAAHYPKED
jgi:hypothetical protein